MPTYIFSRDKGCIVDKRTGKPDPLPKRFVPPRIQIIRDYAAYDCPVTGRMIEGRSAHNENLKRTGCRLLEKGEREQAIRDRADTDRKIEKTVEAAVEKTAANLGI
jgi:hypothetical protein